MLSRTIAFLTPAALVAVAFVVVMGLLHSPLVRDSQPLGSVLRGPVAPEQLPDLGPGKVVLPTPAMSPADVVETQLAGLADPQADGVGILQCYLFASLGNRRVTGPLDRFGAMVRQGPFACLANPQATLVGRTEVEGPVAKILVTVIDDQRQVQVFSFILSRQTEAPFKDCWMTEAVFPVGGLAPPPTPAEEGAGPESA